MSQAVKISDADMQAVREAANIHNRSISGQAEYWLRLGRAVERNPAFGFDRIDQALKGLLSPDDLTGEEQEDFFDRFADRMDEASPQEQQFWADRQARGLGVGMDEGGVLVYPPNRPNRSAS